MIPYPIPSITCSGLFYFICSLWWRYSSSKDKEANPVDIESVTTYTELKVPLRVFLSNDPVPFAIPNPPSKGPWTNP